MLRLFLLTLSVLFVLLLLLHRFSRWDRSVLLPLMLRWDRFVLLLLLHRLLPLDRSDLWHPWYR